MAHSGSGRPSWLDLKAVASKLGSRASEQRVERVRVEEGQVAGEHQPGGIGMLGERGADAGDGAFDFAAIDDARRSARAPDRPAGRRARKRRRARRVPRAASSRRRAASRRGGIRWRPCRAACACCGRRRAPGRRAAVATFMVLRPFRARLALRSRACRRSCGAGAPDRSRCRATAPCTCRRW